LNLTFYLAINMLQMHLLSFDNHVFTLMMKIINENNCLNYHNMIVL